MLLAIMVRSHGDKAPVTIGGRQVGLRVCSSVRSFLAGLRANVRGMSTVMKPSRPRNRRRDLLWLPRVVYISTTGHPGQKWNGVYDLALFRGALRESPSSIMPLFFDYVPWKRMGASERGESKKHIPRKTDGAWEFASYLHESSMYTKLIWSLYK